MSKRIVPVILSGGSGTRLWPLSRLDRPKQLIAIAGEHSLLQETALRTRDPNMFDRPVVVASAGHAEQVELQLDDIGVSPAQLIIEPEPRNTAAAIALAALVLGPGDILLVLPSDHVVKQPDAFRAAIESALPLARDGMLVTFGITPDRPETGYGYIKRGAELSPGLFQAERFVEKPDSVTAQAYLSDGGYLWNAGIFLFSADSFLDALELHAPEILFAARASIAAQRADGIYIWPDARGFGRAPGLSIDHAVMEKSDRVAVAPVAMGWSDVGSWEALHAIGEKDASGNVLTGDVVAIDSRDCLIRSDGPVIVTLGAQDLIVVATERAVLIAPRGESQRVKEAIDALQKRGK
ncbi:MAG TPA: mannose-1-phosphate guanylyltransferase/mannose-6-phosphate isomerase [Allosphingosinicella sp.]|jgi:mannose-1-phosphate guanylyltransferase/mannose-1-phosphate guanylyltransferase/mannose-6-phosphate isomerase|uniref:mannose-1-phosphate guanylyltransferase/mannose-6-phosphate isomerase n=1 Tax=Allosphingosinicella sp. TaxID=2823234 RepID=UPI002F29CA51